MNCEDSSGCVVCDTIAIRMARNPAGLLKASIVAAIVVTILARTCVNIVDIDIWHQMALAREIFASGRFPRADPFAYTSTVTPFVNHEWGAGVVAYLLAVHVGPWAILALKYMLIAATTVICYACAKRRGGELLNWAPLAVPAVWLAAIGYLPVRAQDYTYLAVAALMWCLMRDEEGSRKWILPWLAAFPLWANLHGGATVAFVLLAAHWLERVIVRKPHLHLIGISAGMAALLFVNPYGADYLYCLWRALALKRSGISEWQPIWAVPGNIFAAYLVCAAAAGCLLIIVAWRSRRIPFGAAMVLATAVLGGMHVKLAPVFAIVFISLVPGWLAGTSIPRLTAKLQRDWADVLSMPWLILIVVMTYSAAFASATRPWELKVPGVRVNAPDSCYPVGAVEYLKRERFAGNLMTTFDYGAYCSWKLYPRVKVSLDGRFELVYSLALFERSGDFYSARPGWQSMLRDYPTDVALIPTNSKAAGVMPTSGWERVYSDSEYELYARPGLGLPHIERHGPPPDGTFP